MKDMLQDRAIVDRMLTVIDVPIEQHEERDKIVDDNNYVLNLLLKSDMGKAFPTLAIEISNR